MNDRSTALLLIAVALAGYGVYIAGYVPAMRTPTAPRLHRPMHSAARAASASTIAAAV
ncbi:MAG TPA: hypothetical protein VF515_17290 [Candidatus Binatia bacterium]